jgi:hypothetical protein
MITFKEFLARQRSKDVPSVRVVYLEQPLLEYETYKNIPGSKNSYRQDPGNINTKTQKHVHVYAKPKGKGKEIYSVNVDGSGHDGYSGTEIPASHGRYFRSKGYDIKPDNIIEWIDASNLAKFSFIILIEEAG